MPMPTRDETVKGILNIKKAITLVESHKMLKLSGDLDLWDEGIHLFMSDDIPFTHSFDEVMFDISKENELILEPKMVKWLEECLYIADSHLAKLEKENKDMHRLEGVGI